MSGISLDQPRCPCWRKKHISDLLQGLPETSVEKELSHWEIASPWIRNDPPVNQLSQTHGRIKLLVGGRKTSENHVPPVPYCYSEGSRNQPKELRGN